VDFGVTVRHSVFGSGLLKSLGFGWPTGEVDSSLEAPRSYADVRVCSRAKTVLVLRDFKILFGVLFSVIPGAWLAGICPDPSWVSTR
jgi:hypothetical protein